MHSCLCFSLFEKLFLKAISTPSYLSSFQDFSYRNLDTSSTPGGSIKPHLLCLMFLYLDTFSTPVSIDSQILDTLLNTSQHLHLSSFTEVLYILPHVIRTSFLSISLSLSLDKSISSSPKHSHLTPNLLLKVSSSFFKSFFTR